LKKTIANFIQSDKGIIIAFIVIIFFSTWAYMSYTTPIVTDIKYSWEGIKYQAGNYEYEELINIEVTGVYTKIRSSGDSVFKGEIVVNGEMSQGYGDDGNEYAFNDETNHNIIHWESFIGDLYIGDTFKEISIDILEPIVGFNYNDGWIISAPADNRSKAVEISNRIIQKLHKDVLIK